MGFESKSINIDTNQLATEAKKEAETAAKNFAKDQLGGFLKSLFGPFGAIFDLITGAKRFGITGPLVDAADGHVTTFKDWLSEIVDSALTSLSSALGMKPEELPTRPDVKSVAEREAEAKAAAEAAEKAKAAADAAEKAKAAAKGNPAQPAADQAPAAPPTPAPAAAADKAKGK